MPENGVSGECLVAGTASGQVLSSGVPLSFWGGVDPFTGMIIDKHHPLLGHNLRGKVLAIPGGRGSCGGSGVILELLRNGNAPAALVFCRSEMILTVGVVIASELFDRRIPVLRLDPTDFARLQAMPAATIVDGAVGPADTPALTSDLGHREGGRAATGITLSDLDHQLLDGQHGEAARAAMRIVLRAAQLEGARDLIDVEMAHIDGVFYQGPASLEFATTLRDLGAKVRVPASMNPICVDRKRWRGLGVPTSMGEPSDELADAYEQMGVAPTYTCAPYLLSQRPAFGQQIAFGESNAVAYANSVIGARTMKYPNYLDLLVAITGRAPNAGCHRDSDRRATVVFVVEPLDHLDDSLFPVLGYHVGERAPNEIPAILGLEASSVSADDLKAFGAAFATTSAVPMFHIVGITPEASTLEQATGGELPGKRHLVTVADLRGTWNDLNSACEPEIDFVAIGTPHCSLSEIARVAELLTGSQQELAVPLVITCGREVYEQAMAAGHVATIESFGGKLVNDTCWCLILEPIVPPAARNIVTNSGKYAHYGAAALDRGMHLRSLPECVRAARTGRVDELPPRWLRP